MSTVTFNVADEQGTQRLAERLAKLLPSTAVIALNGTLGAGKTRFVQLLAAATGIDQQAVVSPTFVLVQEYRGRVPIYHFDAYRLRDEDEFTALGADEYLAGHGWCLIEWAERVANCLPHERLEIQIDVTGETARRFTLTPHGGNYEQIVQDLAVRK